MALILDTKRDRVNPGESTAKALHEELRRRGVGNDSSVCGSPPTQAFTISQHLLEQIQKASEKGAGSSRCSTVNSVSEDAGKGGTPRSGIMSSARSADIAGSQVLVGHRSLPTPQCTPPTASTLRGSRMASAPTATGARVKKRRNRASKKPPTKIVTAGPDNFREVVVSLTGGTFCSQTTATASPIVSSTPSVSRNAAEPSIAAAEAYVVRPQASRPNANGTLGDSGSSGAEVSSVAPTGNPLQVSEELPAFLLESMLQEDGGSLNYILGYTNEHSWSGTESSTRIVTESVGVSSSSQFPGVYPSEVLKTSVSVYSRTPVPFLMEGTDASREGDPYKREASLGMVGSKGFDLLPRHLLDEDCDVDSWLNADSVTPKNVYIN